MMDKTFFYYLFYLLKGKKDKKKNAANPDHKSGLPTKNNHPQTDLGLTKKTHPRSMPPFSPFFSTTTVAAHTIKSPFTTFRFDLLVAENDGACCYSADSDNPKNNAAWWL